MQFETFRGRNVQEALAAVRAALGPDALIESTRHVSNGGQGWLGRSFVEVLAAPVEHLPKSSAQASAVRTGLAAPAKVSALALDRGRPEPPRSSPRSSPQEPLLAALAQNRGQPTSLPAVDQELRVIRAMIEELSLSRKPRDRALAMLQAAGIEGTLARELSKGLARVAREPGALERLVRHRLAERLRVLPSPIEQLGPRIIACVGPTGAGKTTTLAKLAARAQLDLGRSVSVVTLDTFRVGAVEQMRRWVELIGVPFDVARDRSTFVQAMASRKTDLVFVDTAGSASTDHASMRRMAECLQAVPDRSLDVLLVVPASVRVRDAQRLRETYRDPAPAGMVITKIDETDQIGGAIHGAIDPQLPVAYVCDGPRVPEDLHEATVETIVEAALRTPR